MQIIKHGDPTYLEKVQRFGFECVECGCKYITSRAELVFDSRDMDHGVHRCPECGRMNRTDVSLRAENMKWRNDWNDTI